VDRLHEQKTKSLERDGRIQHTGCCSFGKGLRETKTVDQESPKSEPVFGLTTKQLSDMWWNFFTEERICNNQSKQIPESAVQGLWKLVETDESKFKTPSGSCDSLMKICPKCNKHLPLANFGYDKKKENGIVTVIHVELVTMLCI
jgi:hypothetical protein